MRITRAIATEKLGYCRKGLKAFCDANGIDWETFCNGGIDPDDYDHIKDERALKLLEALRNEFQR